MARVAPADASLWKQVEQFELDAPQAAYPYSRRLASENGWSARYAERVVHEYRRFLYLAGAAGHPVSPSPVVDQAWHLHLLYTRSYWDDLCGQVLRQSFHHVPGAGGEAEKRKFQSWYDATIRSYQREFGEAPPADIWPRPGLAEGEEPRWQRVDRRRAWIIPKPGLGAGVLAICLLALLATGCSRLLTVGGPWDWRGPEFLRFYFWLFVGVWVAVLAIRWRARRGGTVPKVAEDLSPYETAYLAGRNQRTIDCALASLIHRGHIKLKSALSRRLVPGEPLPVGAHPLDVALASAVRDGGGMSYRDLHQRAAVRKQCRQLDHDLVNKGLLLSRGRAFLVRLATAGLFLGLLAFGLSKVHVGFERQRPVAYLVLLCVVTALFGVAFLFWPTRQTRLAKRALRRRHAAERPLQSPGFIEANTPATAVSLAVALFGLEILRGSSLNSVAVNFQRFAAGTGGSGSSGWPDNGSSWSGSSWSGGGGCGGGGGGGGGGGCGGCGGG